MKKLVALSLLPVFLFSILGWQWMFFLKLYSHELMQWNSADENENYEMVVVPLTGKSPDTYFLNSKELIHCGKLFDIKFKKIKGNDMLCYCERDGAEEDLLSAFNGKTQDHFDNAISSQSSVQKIVKVSAFENTSISSFDLPSISVSEVAVFFKVHFPLPSVTNSFFVPPDAA